MSSNRSSIRWFFEPPPQSVGRQLLLDVFYIVHTRCGVHSCRVNGIYYKSIIISCVVFTYEIPGGDQFLASIRARRHSITHTMSINCLEFRWLLLLLLLSNIVDIKIRVKLNSVCACSFFCSFWHSPITFTKIKIEHIEKIEKDMIISRRWWWYWTVSQFVCLVAIIIPFRTLLLMFVAFIVFTFSIEVSVSAVKLWCLLSLSSICARSNRICNNKWLLDFGTNTRQSKSEKGKKGQLSECVNPLCMLMLSPNQSTGKAIYEKLSRRLWHWPTGAEGQIALL